MSTGSTISNNTNTISNSTNDGDTKASKTTKLNNSNASTSLTSTASTKGTNSNNYNSYTNSGDSNGSIKNRGPGRPSKKSLSTVLVCAWCTEKSILPYVLPTQGGKKEFCSETCIKEFRAAYSKGACIQCDNAIRANAPNREFCSTYCMNKYQRRNGSNASIPSHGSNGIQSASSKLSSSSQHNNNNVNNYKYNCNFLSSEHRHYGGDRVTTLNEDTVGAGNQIAESHVEYITYNRPRARSLQYDRFHIFNWADYLNVDQLSNPL